MRFLALETNTRALKKQFIADGEEELLATTRHAFAFLLPMLWLVPLAILLVAAWGMGIATGLDPLLATALLYAGLVLLLAWALKTFIDWRYNIVIITTEKIVVITHRFIFSQSIRPYNLDSIASVASGSQYFGIGNCGFVTMRLSTIQAGTNMEITLDRLPKPAVIASVIENARVLQHQRSPADQGPEAQEEKVQRVQEQTQQEIPGGAVGNAAPATEV